jgi:hypothetical protein
MSGKTGRRPTGRKPDSVRRQSSKTTGAFGKETAEQVVTGETSQNTDKATRTGRTSRAGSGK